MSGFINLSVDDSRCSVPLLHLLVNDPGLQDSNLLLVAGGHLKKKIYKILICSMF